MDFLALQRAKLELLHDVVVEGRLTAAHLLEAALEELASVLQFDHVLLGCNEKERLRLEVVYSRAHDGTWKESAFDETFPPFPFRDEAHICADLLGNAEFSGNDFLRRLRVRSFLVYPIVAQGRTWYWMFASRQPRRLENAEDEMNLIEAFAAIVSRLIELRDEQALQKQHISTDGLTGLLTRSATLARLHDEIASAERNGSRVAVLYMDMDRFKWVNDTYGHGIGDAVLREIGKRLRESLRPYDIAGRLGGDEFAIIISRFASDDELADIASRLIQSISQALIIDSCDMTLGATIGIATYPNDSPSPDDLLRRADTAMYEVKRQGPGSFGFYNASAEDRVKSRRIISEGLRAKRMDSEFIMCLQPITEVHSGRLARAEVLTRWLHPEMGLLPPSRYIEIARDNRLIATLDSWVIVKAMETALKFAGGGDDIILHTNVSAPNNAVIEAITAFPDYKSAAKYTAIELHEETIASSWEECRAFIERCREIGIKTGIDGFGTVGIPLARLAKLPIDFIKIGRDLIAKVTPRFTTPAVELAIVTARHFGCDVIAEGVENDGQRSRLAEAGVKYVQGYGIAHPLTLVDFQAWKAAQG